MEKLKGEGINVSSDNRKVTFARRGSSADQEFGTGSSKEYYYILEFSETYCTCDLVGLNLKHSRPFSTAFTYCFVSKYAVARELFTI